MSLIPYALNSTPIGINACKNVKHTEFHDMFFLAEKSLDVK